MANSLLLHEATGIGYARRQDIVDQAETNCFTPMDAGHIPNPHSPENFYLLTKDFAERLLPELCDREDPLSRTVESADFAADLDLTERFMFLRAVARCVELAPQETEPVAELLGVRPALLMPANTQVAAPKQYKLQLFHGEAVSSVNLTGEQVSRLALDIATTTFDTFHSPHILSQKAV